ncbi:hypothetical protein ACWESM_18520 [Nocardia sp. NPDC003999]
MPAADAAKPARAGPATLSAEASPPPSNVVTPEATPRNAAAPTVALASVRPNAVRPDTTFVTACSSRNAAVIWPISPATRDAMAAMMRSAPASRVRPVEATDRSATALTNVAAENDRTTRDAMPIVVAIVPAFTTNRLRPLVASVRPVPIPRIPVVKPPRHRSAAERPDDS